MDKKEKDFLISLTQLKLLEAVYTQALREKDSECRVVKALDGFIERVEGYLKCQCTKLKNYMRM